MKKKIIEQFIFDGFGFPIILKDVIVDSYDGEEFPEINYNELKSQTVRALILSKRAFSGNQLRFLRKFMHKSLRDLADDLKISHAQVKNWEDKGSKITGMTQDVERRLKNYTLNFLMSLEQRVMSDMLLNQQIDPISSDAPFDPYSEELKYG